MTTSPKEPVRRPGQIARAVSSLRNLAARGPRGAALHLRTAILHHGHDLIDRLAREPTAAKSELDRLSIDGSSRASGTRYEPTPWRILDWVHAALPADKSVWTFVDLGAGKGRAVLSAARHGYRRVVGVEFARELVDVARAEVSALARAGQPDVTIIHGDAARFELPAGPTIVFLFNPFGPPVIGEVAENVVRAYSASQRPLVVAYYNPANGAVFDRPPILARTALPRPIQRRLKLLSPYNLHLYATTEAMEHLPGNAPR